MDMNAHDYQSAYDRSLSDPDGFWAEAAESISWFKKWDQVLDRSRPPFTRWFIGGLLITCDNAVDRHVERGRGKQRALI
jgi:propionyl-CoA synthetase